MPLRLEPAAAEQLREAIREAGGVEVFAIGDVDRGSVVGITVTCRGTADSVFALVDRPRAGQVVIHNHPSGNLQPSEPDMALAALYGEDGVGVVIVDSAVTEDNWVVEPHDSNVEPVDAAALEHFFAEGLPAALDGWEARPQQLEMARRVADCLDRDRPLMCEAGTGTGKSLAYLAPAALWAKANDTKVVVSTFTKALQVQLLTSDLPLLGAGGIQVRTAVLQGRNNYLCKRRLELVRAEGTHLDDHELDAQIEALADWSQHTRDGSRSDLGFNVEPEVWDRVLSDSDLSLSVRCPHYATCHYYRARRQAAAAHVIVVNHALLLTDLAVREEAGRGFLPRYDRVIIDEAHHLEDAATGVATDRLSLVAVRRAVSGLRDTKRRKGALTRLVQLHPQPELELGALASEADHRVEQLATDVQDGLVHVAETLLHKEPVPTRITPEVERGEPWRLDVVPTVRHLCSTIGRAVDILDKIETRMGDAPLPEDKAQPVLDLRRARRRLARHLSVANAFLEEQAARCRWAEPGRRSRGKRQGPMDAALCSAPIDVAPVLRRILWQVIGGVANTSATLTVGGSFAHLSRRVGLAADVVDEVVFPSPFDHSVQACLGLPRDLPTPDDGRFLAATSEVVVDAIRVSDGGAFVLCTSYAAVNAYAAALRAQGGRAVLAQGEAGRGVLLDRFRRDRRAVLVGTDSFWEGVSVRGDGLRLVVIPRIPFRVPTEPLLQARHERMAAAGRDPFQEYSLPEAILKLRQGYGRLIRSHTDRGVVLLLDRRLHDRRYGVRVLRSLPPARRVKGPWRRVREAVVDTLAIGGDDGSH